MDIFNRSTFYTCHVFLHIYIYFGKKLAILWLRHPSKTWINPINGQVKFLTVTVTAGKKQPCLCIAFSAGFGIAHLKGVRWICLGKSPLFLPGRASCRWSQTNQFWEGTSNNLRSYLAFYCRWCPHFRSVSTQLCLGDNFPLEISRGNGKSIIYSWFSHQISIYIIGDFPLPRLIIIGYQFSFAADHYSVLFAQMGMWHVYMVNGCKTQVGIRPYKLTFLVVYSCLFQYIPLYSNCCYLSCSPTSHLELQLTIRFWTIYLCIFKPPIDAWLPTSPFY